MAKKQETFRDFLEEKYADLLVIDESKSDIKAIPTGSISLDFSIGVGGVPRGRFTEIYGPPSCGKTTLTLDIAKNTIAMGRKVLYIDSEHGLDYSYIKSIVGSVDPNEFLLLQVENSDEAFDISEKAIASGEFGLIVLDSIGSLVSSQERENEFAKDTVARIPRDLTKFLRRNGHAIRNSDTAYIFINQIRDKIGSYVPMVESPGGYGLKHMCSVRIMLTSSSAKSNLITMGDKEVGIVSNFVIKKNKLAAPFKSSHFPIIWGVGIDKLRDIVEFTETVGVIRKAGSYYRYTYNGEEITLGQGMNNTIEYLKENKLVLDSILNECYTLMHKERENYIAVKEGENEQVD